MIIGLALATTACLALSHPVAAAVTGAVLVAGVLARQWLLPAINASRDRTQPGDAAARSRFARLHGLSVAINAVQIVLVLGVLVRLAGA